MVDACNIDAKDVVAGLDSGLCQEILAGHDSIEFEFEFAEVVGGIGEKEFIQGLVEPEPNQPASHGHDERNRAELSNQALAFSLRRAGAHLHIQVVHPVRRSFLCGRG